MNTSRVNLPYTELQVGHIVQFYGARFEIYSTETHPQDADHVAKYGVISDTMVAKGRWIDGAIIPGYFGPSKDWTFQGNAHATAWVELAPATLRDVVLDVDGTQWKVREAVSREAALSEIAMARCNGSIGGKTVVRENDTERVLADVIRLKADGTEATPYNV